MSKDLILGIALAVFIIVVVSIATGKCRSRENYRDPLWMHPHKLYGDYYPRARGSIYGTRQDGWDMFSGFPAYPKAY